MRAQIWQRTPQGQDDEGAYVYALEDLAGFSYTAAARLEALEQLRVEMPWQREIRLLWRPEQTIPGDSHVDSDESDVDSGTVLHHTVIVRESSRIAVYADRQLPAAILWTILSDKPLRYRYEFSICWLPGQPSHGFLVPATTFFVGRVQTKFKLLFKRNSNLRIRDNYVRRPVTIGIWDMYQCGSAVGRVNGGVSATSPLKDDDDDRLTLPTAQNIPGDHPTGRLLPVKRIHLMRSALQDKLKGYGGPRSRSHPKGQRSGLDEHSRRLCLTWGRWKRSRKSRQTERRKHRRKDWKSGPDSEQPVTERCPELWPWIKLIADSFTRSDHGVRSQHGRD
ncbi:hypothetical protein C8R44DRAFT_736429 [Mycena epipterygia]|nr:hypothetical protein C8R44DRAFT_736429 [Mycena epipterygia]